MDGGKDNISTHIVLIYILFFVSIIDTVKVNQIKTGGESSFSYEVGAPNGPQNWGNLNATWRLCGTGQSQSPVDLVDDKVVASPSFEEFRRYYFPAPATIRTRGHDIQVQWRGDAGGILINGDKYMLESCHWHIPSEHTVNGHRFTMELHIVHSNSHGDTAVVAVLYNLGLLPNLFLARLYPFLGSVREEESYVGVVDPWNIEFNSNEYYRYNGSLTTPPCSENVTWTIITNVETVSWWQVRALMNAVDNASARNARPIQPLNERLIYLHEPIRLADI